MTSKKRAIIVDIDGTLALFRHHRGPYDTAKAGDDVPNSAVLLVLDSLEAQNEHYFLMVSGRSWQYHELTREWMDRYNISCDTLYMRPDGDQRPDTEIKREIYERQIAPEYDVELVLDDRSRIVSMWRELGLPCFQVAEGDF